MAQVSDIVEALKYTYGADRVAYLFNEEVPLWTVLSRKKAPMGGRTNQFLLPILTKNPGNWVGIAEGGALPSALQPDTAEAYFKLQEFVGIYDVTWKLIQDSRKSEFAFARAVQMMDEGLRRRVFRLLNADLLGTGRGELGVLGAADNQTTITVRHLPRVEVGMSVDLMDDTDDNAKVGPTAATVTAVDPITREITTGTAGSGTAAGDYFTTAGTVATGYSRHMNGILGVIDDANPKAVVGNIGAIDRSAAGNEYWKSVVLGNSGTNRAFTEDLGLQAEDAVREKGGGRLTHYFSNLAIGRRYHEILRAETLASLGSVKALSGGLGREGGEKAADGRSPYSFSGVSWHFDPFFDANIIVGFDRDHFFLGVGENEVPRPISEIFDGVPFFKETANATFQVVWYWQGQLLTDNPAAGVKIEDVAES